jgi:hypothetical protein
LAAEGDGGFFHPSQFPAADFTAHHRSQQVVGVPQTSQSKLKSTFGNSINAAPPPPSEGTGAPAHRSTDSSTSSRKAEIVYVRDLDTGGLVRALFQLVRQGRADPIAETTSPVLNPTAILFGATPPWVRSYGLSGGGGVLESMNLKMRSTC